MTRWVCSLIILCTLLLPTVAEASTKNAQPPPPPVGTQKATGSTSATGIIVSTNGPLPEAALGTISLLLGRDVVGQSPMGDSLVSIRLDKKVPTSTVRSVTKLLNAMPEVAQVSPDLVATTDAAPNDTYFPQQTNLWSPASVASDTGDSADYSINAPAMWEATQGRKSVVVAVVDSGIVAHPDLARQTVPGWDMIADSHNSGDGGGRDSNAADPGNGSNGTYCTAHSSTWHGTHVAGIIGALRNNKIGISGIAPGVTLQPVRVAGQCGATMSDVVAGIRWASGGDVPGIPRNKTPADVINLSLSSTVTDNLCPAAYQDVIDEARARGVVVVASAGNQGKVVLSRTPANCRGVLSVGATDDKGAPTSYTNAGYTIGMMAPGGEVGEGQGIWSTVDAGTAGPSRSTYGQLAGTSMAAPAVSAAAALVLSLGDFTNDEVVQVLKAAAVKPPHLSGYFTCISTDPNTGAERSVCGAGILNLAGIPAPVGQPALTGAATVGSTLSVAPRWNGHPDSVTYQWLRSGEAIAGATDASYVLTGDDLGRTLTVRSTAHTQGYPDFSGLSVAKEVSKAGASVALELSSTRAKLKVTRLNAQVLVTATQGQVPGGNIEVYIDGKRNSTVPVVEGGQQVLLPVFRSTGKHKVQVRYSGSAGVSGASSPTITVTVSK
jgi:serine protease